VWWLGRLLEEHDGLTLEQASLAVVGAGGARRTEPRSNDGGPLGSNDGAPLGSGRIGDEE
jgi:hypothetical protein